MHSKKADKPGEKKHSRCPQSNIEQGADPTLFCSR